MTTTLQATQTRCPRIPEQKPYAGLYSWMCPFSHTDLRNLQSLCCSIVKLALTVAVVPDVGLLQYCGSLYQL